MSVRLVKGQVQATVHDSDGRGGLSIAVSQKPGGTARWQFSVRAKTDEGTFHVGECIVTPPPRTVRGARVVAIATCPGAKDWTVLATLASGEPDDALLSLAVGAQGGGGPGLVRVGERFKYYSGACGAVSILPGETVIGWSAWALVVGATVAIGSGGTCKASPSMAFLIVSETARRSPLTVGFRRISAESPNR